MRDTIVQLSNASLSIGVAPALGGSLAWFRASGRDVLRPLTDDALQRGDILSVAMFPMVPFANRIANNSFSWNGQRYGFQPNLASIPLHVHGCGWTSPWQLARHANDEIVLALSYDRADYPYRFEAMQRFRLDPDGLAVTIEVRNSGGQAMPFGLGLHPWFRRTPDTQLRFGAKRFWLQGSDGVSSEPVDIGPEQDFSELRGLPQTGFDNDYAGWEGSVEIAYPRERLAVCMQADPIFGHLMFYADPAIACFCVEPQTHLPSAFTKVGSATPSEMGITVLEPGERMEGTVRFAAALETLASPVSTEDIALARGA